jgi:hypothetical protein
MKVKVTQEQFNKLQQTLLDFGLVKAAQYVGGYKQLSVLFNGNLDPFYKNFSEKYGITPVHLSSDRLRLYIHDSLVQQMNFGDLNFTKGREKALGKFKFGSKGSFMYAFNASLVKTSIPFHRDMDYWAVVGSSGSHGFGYEYINKRDTLGVRYRTQIYNQILDKYDWRKYSNM